MKNILGFCFFGFLVGTLSFAVPCRSASVSAKTVKGSVKLVGRYKMKRIPEGKRTKTYFDLKKSRRMELKASGPVDLVLLLRGRKNENTRCELDLDTNSKRHASLKISKRVSRGLFLKIPDGLHRLAVKCNKNLWFRPLRSKKGPQKNQEVIAWNNDSDEDSLEVPPLVLPHSDKPSDHKNKSTALASSRESNLAKQAKVDEDHGQTPPTNEGMSPKASDPAVLAKHTSRTSPESTSLSPATNMKELCSQLAQRAKSSAPVVVVPFKVRSKTPSLKSLAQAAVSYLNTCLKRDHSIAVVEQQQRSEAFKEIQLSMTGMVDEQKAAKLGRSLGARAMVTGTLDQVGSSVVLNVRAISIEESKVIFSQVLNSTLDSFASVLKLGEVSKVSSSDGAQVKTLTRGDVEGKPAEVRLRMLADRLADGFAKLPGNGRYERLVVAQFKESGEASKDLELGVLISAQLSTFLQRDHGFFILERSRIKDVLKEIQLGMTGLLDPDKAAKAGKMIGAQAIVVGTVSESGADFVVNARLISVETAEVLIAESMSLPRAGMVALSDDSVVLRSRSGSIFRSMVIPGWGQFYNRQPVKGGIVIGLEVALAGAAVATHFLGMSKENEYAATDFALKYPDLDPDQLSTKAQELRSDAESFYGARNILIYSAIGVYLYNILDAYIFGVDGESEMNSDMSAALRESGPGGVVSSLGLTF